MLPLCLVMKSAIAATKPFRSGQVTNKMALFFMEPGFMESNTTQEYLREASQARITDKKGKLK